MLTIFRHLDEFGTYSRLLANPSNIFQHLVDLLILFIAVLLVAFTALGWGQILRKLSGLPTKNHFASTDIWLGVLLICAFVELLNFWLPISWEISLVIFIIGLSSNLYKLKFTQPNKILNVKFWIFLPVIIIGFIFASKALYTPLSSDNLLYHLNTIRWLNEYAAIPGLGNLHGRLAFNQSYFSFIAMINAYPYFMHGPSVGNMFLISLSIISALEILCSDLKLKKIIFAGAFIAIAKNADGLHTTNTDLANSLLQTVIFLQLILVLHTKNQKDLLDQICVTAYLCLLIALFKLSSVVYSFLVIAIIFYQLKNHDIKKEKSILISFCIFFTILFIHFVRGYLLSGAPLYPSTAFSIQSLPWSMPLEEIRAEANWALSWAKAPGDTPDEVLGNWKWFKPWLELVPTTYILMLLSSSLFYFTAYLLKPSNSFRKKYQVIYIPLIGTIIFWFFTAPALRFLGCIPELLVTVSIWLFFCSFATNSSEVIFNYKSKALINTFALVLLTVIAIKSAGIKKISLEGWMPLENRPLIVKETLSGLKVFTPKNDDAHCGDGPIPCTPYFNKNLHLLGKNISSGFSKSIGAQNE